MVRDSLSVNCTKTPIGLGGYDRPRESVENIEEIAARYREKRDPLIRCAYCGNELRSKQIGRAIAWFRTHKCDGEGEQLEVA